MDLRTEFEKFKRVADELVKDHPSDYIYFYLRNSPYILPDGEFWYESVKQSGGNKADNSYLKLLRGYSLNAITYLVSNGITAGKITHASLIEHLKQQSWLGQDLGPAKNGETYGYDWIGLLSPALFRFIEDLKTEIASNEKNPEHYILAIDSLGIKFEGLIREVCRFSGSELSQKKPFQAERMLSIGELLEHKELKSSYSGQDIAFLKAIFSEQGLNLTTNIGRCYFQNQSYTLGNMLLLFFALLKVGNLKFNFNE